MTNCFYLAVIPSPGKTGDRVRRSLGEGGGIFFKFMDFKHKVIAFVKKIPRGKVASYGQIAALCGHPRAARLVGGILKTLGPDSGIPWWRVINSKGEISIKGNWEADKNIQKELLVKDGVKVGEDFTVDMDKFNVKYQITNFK